MKNKAWGVLLGIVLLHVAGLAAAPSTVVQSWSLPVETNRVYTVQVESAAPVTASDYAAVLEWCEKDTARGFRRTFLSPTPHGWQGSELTPTNAALLKVLIFAFGEHVQTNTFTMTHTIATPQPPKKVRMAVALQQTPAHATLEANRQIMIEAIAAAGKEQVELLCLSENFIDRNVARPLDERAFTLDAAFLKPLWEAIREAKLYCVFALHERAGKKIYTTAFLVGPDGALIGRYRKRHLTLSELEAGVTRGTESPVFQTPLGKIGLAICWDVWFPDTIPDLAAQGAEIVCFPLAGDPDQPHFEHVWRTRAMDSGIVLLASVTKNCAPKTPSRIVTPDGEVRAETLEPNGLAWADITMPQHFDIYWLSVGPYWSDRINVFRYSPAFRGR